ncbi:protein translocase subunit SecDF [Dysgonomonas sp. 25]|uniref:protein translocase subunit SecDF n=1 Tax=Dysgonomonas sp. 25 TaxID=2302933 RepID=UPI0013CFDAE8|nr:protein translocase subunit SecDF [Dysgonomonas sp. 25]NDV67848.1 protein translocase subunit SecDF [Dysgonomonas sp. 25]
MQNKGFVTTFAIALALVCLFYLSFTFVTRHYDNKAEALATEYAKKNAGGNDQMYSELYQGKYASYLDSMATERVYLNLDFIGDYIGSDKLKGLGYTLKQCREKELGLGLDLKGGMSVIVEVDVAGVLRSLGDEEDIDFIEVLNQTAAENANSRRDFITVFAEKFKAKKGEDRLAGVFSSKLKDQIQPTDKDDKVIGVLRKELTSAADNSFNILRTRIDRFGVVAPNIQKLSDRDDRIMIELPGIKDHDRVRRLLQGNANLEFWRTYNTTDERQSQDIAMAQRRLDEHTRTILASLNDSTEEHAATLATLPYNKPFSSYFLDNETWSKLIKEEVLPYPSSATIGIVNKNDTAAVGYIVREYKRIYANDMVFRWGFKAEDLRESKFALYALRSDGIGSKKGPALDGSAVSKATANQAQYGSTWEVNMTMTSEGAQNWAKITGAEAKKAIAIVVDGYVYSAPNVKGRIDGGSSSITGNFSYEEASDLENVLKSGRMKASVRIIQENVVGPSLGQEAIDAGLISFILAIAVLMLYMCLAYGLVPGLVANSALLINLFFTMGALAAFGAVLTLPGITGLVLTLAMAVDANVLIYERTKEELRGGKNTKAALEDGYKHAFSAIFDANLTSIITGVILIIFGTGAIQGFATTLIIGIIASFLTAVFLTRIFYEYMIGKGRLRNLKFSTPISKNLFVNTQYNFLGKTKAIIVVVVIVLVAGIASLFTLGLDPGIDFTGGRNYLVRFEKPVSAGEVQAALAPQFEGATVSVLTSGAGSQALSASQLRITTNYMVENTTDSVETIIRNKLSAGIANMSNSPMGNSKDINSYIQSSEHVGPSIADDMKKDASIAVLFAIICMALYILFRFRDMAFSVGTLIAVAHDALMVILFYSLLYKIMPFSMEINQAFIAAILTVIGYSINDKVVIFDRIREMRTLYPKRDITEVINHSLNSTLGRTINTSLSSLLVVLCIFILGGETIRSFTFAIMLGIIIGTFSSIFVATPIAWKMLAKKQKTTVEK